MQMPRNHKSSNNGSRKPEHHASQQRPASNLHIHTMMTAMPLCMMSLDQSKRTFSTYLGCLLNSLFSVLSFLNTVHLSGVSRIPVGITLAITARVTWQCLLRKVAWRLLVASGGGIRVQLASLQSFSITLCFSWVF